MTNTTFQEQLQNAENLFAQGHHQEALQAFLHLNSLYPDSSEVSNNLGVAYYSLGELEHASYWLQLATQLSPDFQEARDNLHTVRMALKNSKIDTFPKDVSLPSEVITASVKLRNNYDLSIKIPKNEVFRVKNIFEHNEYALPKGYKPPKDMVVVDIGANVGTFALYAKQWSSNVNIHCYEPNPQVIDLLKQNLQLCQNIQIHSKALSDQNNELNLYLHPQNTGATTLTDETNTYQKMKVPVKNAKEAFNEIGLSSIDVLKIDTEGSEVNILKSIESMLPNISIIMLEYHSEKDRHELDNILNGFYLYDASIMQTGTGTFKYCNKRLYHKKEKSSTLNISKKNIYKNKFPNIFILGTGRCGTTSFIAACKHITNYTSGHETRIDRIGRERLSYPCYHIEADNRLSWLLGRMNEIFGKEAFYVHLKRDIQDTAKSFIRRFFSGSIMNAYSNGILMLPQKQSSASIDSYQIALDYIDTVTKNIETFLQDKPHTMTIHLETINEQFPDFIDNIGAQGDLQYMLNELNTPKNASPTKLTES